MTFADTNITFSKQVCDIAVGAVIGGAATLYFLGRLFLFLLCFYAIYRITEIFIRKYKFEKKSRVEK